MKKTLLIVAIGMACGAAVLSGSRLIDARAAQSAGSTELKPASEFLSIQDKRARSIALFQEAGKVIQSPRCLNCHPVTDRPTQGDDMHLHQPPVKRGAGGMGAPGMRCFTCHGAANFDPGKVPGNPKWMLAPASMAWVGKSLSQICAQIKDPARNGGRSMAQIVEHMAHDDLVGWGWHPGAGRTPAPGTQEEFGALIKAWTETGAHCPKS
jgi:hypothetical protein